MAQKRAPKTVVTLEYNPPVKLRDGRWQVDAVAIASLGQNALEGESIKFYLNNQEEAADTTDSDGRAPYTFFAPAGMYSFSIGAQIEGKAARARKVINLPMPPVRKPDRWFIDPMGARGKHVILISIISEDGLPTEGVLIEVMDLGLNPPKFILTEQGEEWRTDSDGKIRIELPEFKNRYRSLFVKAPGTGFQPRRLRLAGPPRWETPPRAKNQIIPKEDFEVIPKESWWYDKVPNLLARMLKAAYQGWAKGKEEYNKL